MYIILMHESLDANSYRRAFSCNFTWRAFHLSPRKRLPSRNPICSYLITIDPISNRIEAVLDSIVFR